MLQGSEAEGHAKQLESVPQPPALLEPQVQLLDGLWNRIYLKSGAKREDSDLKSSTIRAADEEEETQNVSQMLDIANMRAENAAEFLWLFGLRATVFVDASLKALEDNATVEVRFRNVFLKISKLPELWFSIRVFLPKRTLKTVYLSKECKVVDKLESSNH